jgi:hypothetical protein
MKTYDFIPANDRTFLQWVINFLKQLNAMLTRIGFPTSEYQLLSTQRDDFATKLALSEEPATRTKVTIANKNVARRLLEKTIRLDIKEFLNFNRALTDGDREALGLPVYKTTRTPASIAERHPDFDVYTGEIRRLDIHFFDQEKDHTKAKPEGQHGAEIRWAICETPPEIIDDLVHSAFDTRTPFTLDFDENQRGKTVYFALRWENTRGLKGPWSPIIPAIIP